LGGDSLSCSSFVPVALLIVIRLLINLYNNERKEALMEQIKKVKIAIKLGLTSIMETFWAIGTSAVAGDVLLKKKARKHNRGTVLKSK